MSKLEEAILNLALLAVAGYLLHRWLNGRKLHSTAHGSAFLMTEAMLKEWGLLTGQGLYVARSLQQSLIRIADYTHTLIIGATGSGKGIGYVIPNLLTYRKGSVVVFDPKGDLYKTTAKHRAKHGSKVILLSPGKGHRFNPMTLIERDSKIIPEEAAALAASLAVPEPGEKEPHWNQRARQILTAVIAFVLWKFVENERNLNTVQDIVSTPRYIKEIGEKLSELGGIYARFGGHIASLFEGEIYTKEGAGVMSTVTRNLTFLDSERVGECVSETTFDVSALMMGRLTIYLHIPPHMLEAWKGLLRLWVGSFVRLIGRTASEVSSETLFLLDEASALSGLTEVEEALVRGRSAGVRLVLVYQSDDQARAAFVGKPTLIHDNCDTQIYLGASSIETAKRISESIGNYTEEVITQSTNYSTSAGTTASSASSSQGGGMNSAYIQRALIDPSEILRLGNHLLILLHRGLPAPILARRIRWFEDPAFVKTAKPLVRRGNTWREKYPRLWRVLVVLVIVMTLFVIRDMIQQHRRDAWQASPPKETKSRSGPKRP